MNDELERRLEELAGTLERMQLDEYVEHISNRKRLIWDNLLYGMVRGFGFTLGFAVLAALCAVGFWYTGKATAKAGKALWRWLKRSVGKGRRRAA